MPTQTGLACFLAYYGMDAEEAAHFADCADCDFDPGTEIGFYRCPLNPVEIQEEAEWSAREAWFERAILEQTDNRPLILDRIGGVGVPTLMYTESLTPRRESGRHE